MYRGNSDLKSVHFKKTVARISFLSKFVLKLPQFWKKGDSRNWLFKMNGLKGNQMFLCF